MLLDNNIPILVCYPTHFTLMFSFKSIEINLFVSKCTLPLHLEKIRKPFGATHLQCIDPFYFSVTINPFVPNAPFLYPDVFRVGKGCIGKEWVNGNTEIKWVNALLMCCSNQMEKFNAKIKNKYYLRKNVISKDFKFKGNNRKNRKTCEITYYTSFSPIASIAYFKQVNVKMLSPFLYAD